MLHICYSAASVSTHEKTVAQLAGFFIQFSSKKKGFSRRFNETMEVHDSRQHFTIHSVIHSHCSSVTKMLL